MTPKEACVRFLRRTADELERDEKAAPIGLLVVMSSGPEVWVPKAAQADVTDVIQREGIIVVGYELVDDKARANMASCLDGRPRGTH